MKKVRCLYLLVVIPALAIGLSAFLLDARSAIRSHAELDYGEGIVLWQASHVTNWAQAYHRIDVPPYVVFHYPPLYHLASRVMFMFTGDLLAAGRLLSIVSLLAISLVMGALCWCGLAPLLSSSARILGAVSSALLIFTLPSWKWACFMRVDTFAIFLTVAAIALFVLGRDRPHLVLLSFLLFVAAGFAKQTMIAAPAACALLLLLEAPRLFVRAGFVAAGTALVILALLHSATHGAFLVNVISYNRNHFSPGQLLRFQFEHIESAGPVLAACILIPGAFLFRLKLNKMLKMIKALLLRTLTSRLIVVTSTVFGAAVAVTMMVGKQGANYNYFLEMDVLTSLGAGIFVGYLLDNRRHGLAERRPLFALFATLVLALHSTRVEPYIYSSIIAIHQQEVNHASELVNLIRDTSGPVYSEDMTVLVQAGKEVEAEPAIITTLALGGQWDERPFVREIENRRFSLIVVNSSLTNKDRFTPRVAYAVQTHYALSRRLGVYALYVPF